MPDRTESAERRPPSRRAALLHWLRRVGGLMLTVVLVEYAAVHLFAGARESWTSVLGANPALLALAFVLEIASWCCFSGLTFTLLPTRSRGRYPAVLAIDVTGNGSSHAVPGGGATAAALRFRLLGRAGTPLADAISVATLESVITTLWLVVAFVLGLIAAVPHPLTHPLLKTASVLVIVVLVALSGLVAVLMVRPDQVVAVTHAIGRRLPFVRPDTLERQARNLTGQLRVLLDNREHTRQAALWSLGNWSLDAACLYLSVLAFGVRPNPGGLIATYALVCLIALLPLTPGGLGLVEGVAVPVLVSYGIPHGAALLGVLTWRLFEFWLPIPVALAGYVWLRLTGPGRR